MPTSWFSNHFNSTKSAQAQAWGWSGVRVSTSQVVAWQNIAIHCGGEMTSYWCLQHFMWSLGLFDMLMLPPSSNVPWDGYSQLFNCNEADIVEILSESLIKPFSTHWDLDETDTLQWYVSCRICFPPLKHQRIESLFAFFMSSTTSRTPLYGFPWIFPAYYGVLCCLLWPLYAISFNGLMVHVIYCTNNPQLFHAIQLETI